MAAVAEVRALFDARLKEGISTPPGEFHPSDLENRVNNPNYIKRILLHQHDDVKASANMLWEICSWRQTVGANDINESNINMQLIREGGMFPHGRDVEGFTLLIFKCKQHVKGNADFEELKRCVIYWFNRIEREENGRPISLFFDLDGCGVSNLDTEFIKYLINLMKYYYPAFLQYIIIFQMPWVLSAAFKFIKTLLPASAVSKMKFLAKDTLKELVAPEQALVSWGGLDNYSFEFVPENRIDNSAKKVTFAEAGNHSPGELLKLTSSDIIVFKSENDELSGTVVLTNMDEGLVSFKIRTTSPEKFRVRPSSGILNVGDSQTIAITVQPGYQMKNVSKDRFLIMAVQIPKPNMSSQELTEIWQKSSGSKIDEYRLKCNFPVKEPEKINGNIQSYTEEDKVDSRLKNLERNYANINKELKLIKIYEMVLLFLSLFIAYFAYLIYNTAENNGSCNI